MSKLRITDLQFILTQETTIPERLLQKSITQSFIRVHTLSLILVDITAKLSKKVLIPYPIIFVYLCKYSKIWM